LALLVALAAGLFVPFAASQIRPVFFNARDLRESTGLPLLGTVSRKVGEVEKLKEKRDFRRFVAAFVSLVGAYGVGILMLFLLSIRTA